MTFLAKISQYLWCIIALVLCFLGCDSASSFEPAVVFEMASADLCEPELSAHEDSSSEENEIGSPEIEYLDATPTPAQLEWQKDEMYLFIHFGINTFSEREWGDGTDEPELFNPENLDVDQWALTAKLAGFEGIILTVKHHEGFALWPTAYSDYSISASSWMDGQGDVVKLVSDACRRAGIKFGIYLSPWDRRESTYGTDAYNDFFVGQLTELLTGYGPVFEVWLDNARAPGVDFEYDFERYYRTIRELQPQALIANSGPDIRWVGNELGFAPATNYSYPSPTWWYPTECDVSIRPHWFWREDEDTKVRTVEELLGFYFGCIGKNGVLLLGVPPNSEGVLPAGDVFRLRTFECEVRRIFAHDLLLGENAVASNTRLDEEAWGVHNVVDGNENTFWATDVDTRAASIEIDTQRNPFNIIELKEPIKYGQRIDKFRVEGLVDENWVLLAKGTTIGHRRLIRIGLVNPERIRVSLISRHASPALSKVGAYYDSEAISQEARSH